MAIVQEKLRRLRIAYVAADVADRFVDVAVGDGEIERAIEIGVEKSAAEAQRIFGGGADSGLLSDVVVGSVAESAIEADHFIIEIGDGDAGAAGIFEVAGIHTHSGAGFPFRAEGDSCFDGDIFECAVAEIAVELVGLRVVGDQEIGPAILIKIEHCDTEGFGAGVENSAVCCGVFESSVAAIVEEPAGFASIGFGSAIGFLFAVEAAEDVVLGRPFHVIADEEIEQAITIVIEPESGGAEGLAIVEAARAGDVDESSLA